MATPETTLPASSPQETVHVAFTKQDQYREALLSLGPMLERWTSFIHNPTRPVSAGVARAFKPILKKIREIQADLTMLEERRLQLNVLDGGGTDTTVERPDDAARLGTRSQSTAIYDIPRDVGKTTGSTEAARLDPSRKSLIVASRPVELDHWQKDINDGYVFLITGPLRHLQQLQAMLLLLTEKVDNQIRKELGQIKYAAMLAEWGNSFAIVWQDLGGNVVW